MVSFVRISTELTWFSIKLAQGISKSNFDKSYTIFRQILPNLCFFSQNVFAYKCKIIKNAKNGGWLFHKNWLKTAKIQVYFWKLLQIYFDYLKATPNARAYLSSLSFFLRSFKKNFHISIYLVFFQTDIQNLFINHWPQTAFESISKLVKAIFTKSKKCLQSAADLSIFQNFPV